MYFCDMKPAFRTVRLTQSGAGVELEFVLAETQQEAGLSHRGVSRQDDSVGLLRCHVAQVCAAVIVLFLQRNKFPLRSKMKTEDKKRVSLT